MGMTVPDELLVATFPVDQLCIYLMEWKWNSHIETPMKLAISLKVMIVSTKRIRARLTIFFMRRLKKEPTMSLIVKRQRKRVYKEIGKMEVMAGHG
jgi:hypothetical protein